MTTRELLVATWSEPKLREIQDLIQPLPIRLLSLAQLGLPPIADEEEIEAFDTFEANALAKAHFFSKQAGLPTIADDSGLCVDALDGAPGVRSKRFSGRSDLHGAQLDQANNQNLLLALRDTPPERRAAEFVCVVAFLAPDGEQRLFRGSIHGLILGSPRGSQGFGYDPLFYLPDLDATFAELPPDVKNRLSHRAIAIRHALPHFHEWLSKPS